MKNEGDEQDSSSVHSFVLNLFIFVILFFVFFFVFQIVKLCDK